MKTFFKWLLLLPVALLVLVFAVANRHSTTVVLDPLGLLTNGMTISAPLFIILFLAIMVGVLLGGAASWIVQGKYRRAAREASADLRIMREETRARTEEVARLRTELATLPPPVEKRNAA
jgi:uncharacterized integral membrane protein